MRASCVQLLNYFPNKEEYSPPVSYLLFSYASGYWPEQVIYPSILTIRR